MAGSMKDLHHKHAKAEHYLIDWMLRVYDSVSVLIHVAQCPTA